MRTPLLFGEGRTSGINGDGSNMDAVVSGSSTPHSITIKKPLLNINMTCTLDPRYTSRFILLVSILVISNTCELVSRKLAAESMFNYRWFLVQCSSIINMIICGCILLIQKNYNHCNWSLFPYRQLFFLGFFDFMASSCIMSSLGVVSGPLSIVLPFLYHLITIFLQFLSNISTIETTQCFSLNYFGYTCIFIGIILALYPVFVLNNDSYCPYEISSSMLWNIILMIIGIMISSLAYFWKKTVLVQTSSTPIAFNMVTSLFQTLVGFIAAPVVIELQYITINHAPKLSFITNFADGFKCLSGVPSLANDHCSTQVFIEVIIYALSSIITQIVIHHLLRLHQDAWCLGDVNVSFVFLTRAVQYSLVAASALSFIFLFDGYFVSLLPSYDHHHVCSFIDQWQVTIGMLLCTMGTLLSYYNPDDDEFNDIDLWASIYALDEDNEQDDIDEKNGRFDIY